MEILHSSKQKSFYSEVLFSRIPFSLHTFLLIDEFRSPFYTKYKFDKNASKVKICQENMSFLALYKDNRASISVN